MLDRDSQNNLLHVFTGVIIGAALVFLLANKPQVQIKEVIKERNDTIRMIDTVLDTKIKRIKSLPDTLVQVEFDTLFRDTGHTDTVKTTVYAERRCLEVVDSLAACQQKIAVDDVAFNHIDTLVKTDPAPAPLKQRLLDAGAGLLLGLGLRSLL